MKKMMKAAILLAAAGMVMARRGLRKFPACEVFGRKFITKCAHAENQKDGKLVVGTASGFPPYEFLDTSRDQKIDGIDMKLAEAVAQKLGVKLEVQDMTFQSLLSSITTGKVDIAISAINPTDERRRLLISPITIWRENRPFSSAGRMRESINHWQIFPVKKVQYRNPRFRKNWLQSRFRMPRL